MVITHYLNPCNIFVITIAMIFEQSNLNPYSLQSVFQIKKSSPMISGLNNQNGGGGNTCESYWNSMPVSYKGLILGTLALGLLGIISTIFLVIFADIVVYTINSIQIWRLLTSFLVDISIISVIFKLYMLNFSLPIVEKTYSTSFAILEILVQTLTCNIFFIVIAQLFALLGFVNIQYVASYGLIHLVFTFLWRQTAKDPNAQTKFCFFPCLMPAKYLPWCFLALFMIFGVQLFTFTSCIAGYLQFMVLKKSLIQLPLSFYKKLEAKLPESVKQKSGFIWISDVQTNLRTICRQSSPNVEPRSNNPFQNNNRVDSMNDRVDVVGNGVSIGGSSQVQQSIPSNYKNHWLKEENDEIIQQKKIQKNAKAREQMQNESDRKFMDSNNDTMMSDCPFEFTKKEQDNERKI